MKKLILIVILSLTPAVLRAQSLTPAQKESDFRFLASLYATYYAPYEWKKELFGFDVLNIKSWLDRVAATKTDLDFYEVCVDYVASLNDTHARFSLPSDFVARLLIGVDVYDGKVLIDFIERRRLPESTYPFVVGDELVSVDGKSVEQLLNDFAKYAAFANPISTRRLAAIRTVFRAQSTMPHAPDVGDLAAVVVRRQNGNLETYKIAWLKTGTPLEVGPVPKARPADPAAPSTNANVEMPDYMRLLDEFTYSGVGTQGGLTGVNNFGATTPIFVFGLPATFTKRLGAGFDFFYSGIFKYEGLTFGYIRIPHYAPEFQTGAIQQFQDEINFMNANTDGLIIDEMRNRGGFLCFGEEIATRLIPYTFQATGFRLRAYWTGVVAFYNALVNARAQNAPPEIVARYEAIFRALADANAKLRGLTEPVPLCTSSLIRQPATDASGRVIAYQKPLMLLIDEFTVSTADSVAGMIQDARRGILYGMRTNGAGGNNTTFDAGPFTEGLAGMTIALQTRARPVATPDYPPTIYIENVGVRPEIVNDYMTKQNLLQKGAPFVADFLKTMATYVRTLRRSRRGI